MKVESILTAKGADVITIEPEQSLKEAVVLLVQHNIGALAVVTPDGRLVGMISERDIMREIARHGGNLVAPVDEIMTREVRTASLQDEVEVVMNTMTMGHFRHMPVMDQGKLIGILSMRDVVKAQLDEYQAEIDALRAKSPS